MGGCEAQIFTSPEWPFLRDRFHTVAGQLHWAAFPGYVDIWLEPHAGSSHTESLQNFMRTDGADLSRYLDRAFEATWAASMYLPAQIPQWYAGVHIVTDLPGFCLQKGPLQQSEVLDFVLALTAIVMNQTVSNKTAITTHIGNPCSDMPNELVLNYRARVFAMPLLRFASIARRSGQPLNITPVVVFWIVFLAMLHIPFRTPSMYILLDTLVATRSPETVLDAVKACTMHLRAQTSFSGCVGTAPRETRLRGSLCSTVKAFAELECLPELQQYNSSSIVFFVLAPSFLASLPHGVAILFASNVIARLFGDGEFQDEEAYDSLLLLSYLQSYLGKSVEMYVHELAI